jgi:hypothetical protein
MEIVTKRFLLRDFIELDRSPFLDYQVDPRSQIFYESSAGCQSKAGVRSVGESRAYNGIAALLSNCAGSMT